jgi:CRISPR-associated helicase Cas3/CRISPR-associated endonuclease Cas3-HD
MPLGDCIDRPNKPPGDLVKHCERVAAACGRVDGSLEEKLAFLAGLCHDLAKCAWDWQQYIRSDDKIKRGPPHAPLGAALFAFWSEAFLLSWIPNRRDRLRLIQLAIDWARLIDNHHGRLDDLGDDPPWYGAGVQEEHQPAKLMATCDTAGLDGLIRRHFPDSSAKLADFPAWVEQYPKTWLGHVRDRPVVTGDLTGDDERHALGLRPAALGAKLIFADRADAADWQRTDFDPAAVHPAVVCHAQECQRSVANALKTGASSAVVAKRQELQEYAVNAYLSRPTAPVYTLFLPTGYGKTLTGLRVALEALRTGRCTRIVYVAPFISILSQAAQVIREATSQPVFVHHHLSILGDHNDGTGAEDRQREDHQRFDLLDTWQAPILATTFNQLFRALFPRRAQECLRIPALDEAFVFIDEPQAIEPNIWCAFLRALVVTARQRRCQVLFTTATLPPTIDGLGFDPVPLAPAVRLAQSRYVLRTPAQPWKLADVVGEARGRFERVRSLGVMLNTVRDAVEVFRAMPATGDGEWRFLAAMMLPGHKAKVIDQIRRRLQADGLAFRTGVVSTQVLEAGVDLSFRAILRARSTFHSLAQTAGRGNRHGEGDPAEIVVFTYLREDGKDSRDYVYRDKTFCQMTDAILAEFPLVEESQLAGVLTEYYDRCWRENARTTSLGLLTEAAKGKWSAVAGKEPFGDDYQRVDMFVPGAEAYFSDDQRRVLCEFGCAGAVDLLDQWANGKLALPADKRERFLRRKQISALLRQCCVAVPVKIADRIAEPVRDARGEELWFWRLINAVDYSSQTGLAHHLTRDDEQAGIVVV